MSPAFDVIHVAVETLISLGNETSAFLHQLGRRNM